MKRSFVSQSGRPSQTKRTRNAPIKTWSKTAWISLQRPQLMGRSMGWLGGRCPPTTTWRHQQQSKAGRQDPPSTVTGNKHRSPNREPTPGSKAVWKAAGHPLSTHQSRYQPTDPESAAAKVSSATSQLRIYAEDALSQIGYGRISIYMHARMSLMYLSRVRHSYFT